MAENANVKESRFSKARKNVVRFFKEIRSELKKVIWLNRQQLTNNTITVLLACLLVGVIIWTVDFGLNTIAERVFIK